MRCRLCGGEAEPFETGDLDYGRCGTCGFIELVEDSLPSPAAEEERYLLHNNSENDVGYVEYIDTFLDDIAPFIRPGGAVLDFGSGPEPVPGHRMAERGYSVSLYDPFFAPDEGWRRRTWDAIVLHEVAEHIAEPCDVFSGLVSVLTPGGALCVRTRFHPRSYEEFEDWWYRRDRTHVGFYDESTFALLASRLRLELVLLKKPDSVVMRSSIR